jgi:predicted helicase
VIDLGGDVRADPRLSGTKHNVFGIQTGVAISFMVKRAKAKGCRIRYARRPPLETAEEKLAFLGSAQLGSLSFEEIRPNQRHDWINQSATDFDALLPLVDRATRNMKIASQERAVFKLFANAIKTNRDDRVYSLDKTALADQMRYLLDILNEKIRLGDVDDDELDYSIKWSSSLKQLKAPIEYDGRKVIISLFRPFVKAHFYADERISDRLTDYHLRTFDKCLSERNKCIYFVYGSRLNFCILSSDIPVNYALLSLDPVQYIARHRFAQPGQRIDNITDWALEQFRGHYRTSLTKLKPPITKDAIFHYVYGVLHDPIYRETYALNLKREFPRIPFYADFWRWAEWGERLMDLHIGYEAVEPWPLRRLDTPDERSRKAGLSPKAMLKANKGIGVIQLDTETQITGVPPEAWDYRLGNRSALEWILDQHKEKTPKDPTIRERFNTYRFADHKEKVIDLLMRVTRVSVETVQIMEAMRALPISDRMIVQSNGKGASN